MASASKVEKGHQLYRDGKYKEALLFYTDALTSAKAKPHKIALHSNRAACFLKLHDFNKVPPTWISCLKWSIEFKEDSNFGSYFVKI